MRTFWETWTEELPGIYNKGKAFARLQEHWDLSQNATFNRLKVGKFSVTDMKFIYEVLSIAFDYNRGFFFDSEKFSDQLQSEQRAVSEKYGLVEA